MSRDNPLEALKPSDMRRRLLASANPTADGAGPTPQQVAEETLRRELEKMADDAPPAAPPVSHFHPRTEQEFADIALLQRGGAAPAPAVPRAAWSPPAAAPGRPPSVADYPAEPAPYGGPPAGGRYAPVPSFSDLGVEPSADDVGQLTAENAELRRLIEQAIEQEEEFNQERSAWAAKEAEYARQLSERESQLHVYSDQISQLEDHITSQPNIDMDAPPRARTADELSEMADDIEQERCKLTKERKDLAEERRTLRDDEDNLMKQMRQMEVQMAKERAEIARQRTELQRLHAEVRDMVGQLDASGDATLKKRMEQFQRRQQEVFTRPTPAPASKPNLPAPPQAPQAPAAQAPQSPAKANRDSSIMRRFFGGGGQ